LVMETSDGLQALLKLRRLGLSRRILTNVLRSGPALRMTEWLGISAPDYRVGDRAGY
jgi:hypothetical protein